MTAKHKRRRIVTAYDAWWFLHEHPKFIRKERNPLEPDEVEEARKPAPKPKDDDRIGKMIGRRKGFRVVKDKGGNFWKEWPTLTIPAVAENLDIHYARVDKHGRINDDGSQNLFTECWLEFGQVLYGHHGDGQKWRGTERAYKMHYHDVDLDCGAPTFDEALIKLAKRVQKKYGDYPVEAWQLSQT
jgi:hypothetical protein